jgi:hypothetical protein
MKIESGESFLLGVSIVMFVLTGCSSAPAEIAEANAAPAEAAAPAAAEPQAALAAAAPTAQVAGDAIPQSVTRDTSGGFPAGLTADDIANANVADGRAAVKEVLRWKEGDHDAFAVFMTVDGGSEGSASRDLYVATYRQTGSTLQRVRTLKELSGACEFDLTAEFVPGSIALTNLDGDAEGEVTLGYRTTCRSDMSPSDFKLFILEGDAKYGIRGRSRLNVGDGEHHGGEAKEDFKGAPDTFAGHVRQLWSAHVNE